MPPSALQRFDVGDGGRLPSAKRLKRFDADSPSLSSSDSEDGSKTSTSDGSKTSDCDSQASDSGASLADGASSSCVSADSDDEAKVANLTTHVIFGFSTNAGPAKHGTQAKHGMSKDCKAICSIVAPQCF